MHFKRHLFAKWKTDFKLFKLSYELLKFLFCYSNLKCAHVCWFCGIHSSPQKKFWIGLAIQSNISEERRKLSSDLNRNICSMIRDIIICFYLYAALFLK